MRKVLSFLLSSILFLMLFCGCSSADPVKLDDNDPYNFMSYESDNISSIEQLKLDNSLAEYCLSYKFKYKSDECTVVGYISIPAECVKNKTPYECIVYCRGGNINIGLLGDSDTAQICLETNRVVIATQYRGSQDCTGRDEFGGSDINDVLSLIDMCENFAFVDMDNLCVAGVSRGGMMSYIAARQDERIKRIAAISAPTDLFASYNERDDMKKVLNNFIGGSPDDLPDEYENRSAVYWADEINVPVLIIHSRGDEQVSFSQAEALTEKLESYDKEYYFVTYDDSTHGLHKQDGEIISKWLDGEDISEYVSK